jgi:hypothetical protein
VAEKLELELSADEALVLYDFLQRFMNSGAA